MIKRIGHRFPLRFRKVFSVFLASVCAGLLVGDSFLVFTAVQLISFFGLGIWLAALILRFLWHSFKKRPIQPLKESFHRWLFTLFPVVIFLFLGLVKSAWHIRQVEDFVNFASRQLDARKKPLNQYPQKLPPELEQRRPSIVEYASDGKTYSFIYSPPLTLSVSSMREFDSDTHSWHLPSR